MVSMAFVTRRRESLFATLGKVIGKRTKPCLSNDEASSQGKGMNKHQIAFASSTNERKRVEIVEGISEDASPTPCYQTTNKHPVCYATDQEIAGEFSDPHTTAMFQNAIIYGGNFIQQNAINRRGFELLEKRVSTAAFHNSAQRNDPPKCHPNTRTNVLQSISHWIMQSNEREKWILWLNGAAGAGKSAIMQSIAEQCVESATIFASFFFFRADKTRNTAASLFATLVYQLIQAVPETLNDILLTIERNPLIFDQSLELQLHQLLIQPILRIPGGFQKSFVMIIDGLDECEDHDNQAFLIKLFGAAYRTHAPLLFLVSSRREPQIEAAFMKYNIPQILQTISLDDLSFRETSNDIRRFLVDKFAEIKTTHLRRHLLNADWPPISMIEDTIAKSSGQFIYASVVINYISSPRANPARRFEIVHNIGLRDPSCPHPFAHLDSLYRHIFSQVEHLDKVLDILAYHIITGHWVIEGLEARFELGAGELEVLFSDLTAVILCERATIPNPQIRLLHASLPDFLQDQRRSGQYFIDVEEYQDRLLCTFLERTFPDPHSSTYNWDDIAGQEYWRFSGIGNLIERVPKMSNRLQHAVSNFSSTFHTLRVDNRPFTATQRVRFLKSLKFLILTTDGQDGTYHRIVDMFAEGYAKFWLSLEDEVKEELRESPDLYARIRQIRVEFGGKLSF